MKLWSTGRKWTLAGGIALCISAFLVDAVGIGSVGFGILEIGLLTLGVVLLVVSVAYGALWVWYQRIAVIFFTLCLGVMGAELGARAIYTTLNFSKPLVSAPATTAQQSQPYYADKAWSELFWRENALADRWEFSKYGLWRRTFYNGTYVNIQADGTRLVPNTACEDKEAYQVWVFGGSTVWGTGSPDWGTIPAYLQATLDAQTERPVCVRNYGEGAYTLAQNRLFLTALLDEGQRPHKVIFMVGINEMSDAYRRWQTDITESSGNIAFSNRQQGKQSPAELWLKESFLYRVYERVALPPQPIETPVPQMRDDRPQIIMSVIDEVRRYADEVALLAESNQFDYAFFWSPMMALSQKSLTPAEQIIQQGIALVEGNFYRATTRIFIEQLADSRHFYDISAVLDDVPADEQVWIDGMHITPEGNQRVAQAIFERMAWEGLN